MSEELNGLRIADRKHIAVRSFVRKDAEAPAHVQLPDAAASASIQAAKLALRGDVVQPVPFHVRRARGRGQQELAQTSLDPGGRVLPEEAAVRRSKRQ